MKEDPALKEPVVYDSSYPVIRRLLRNAQGNRWFNSNSHSTKKG